jgi:uncharacterized iron-regulated membrane protein
MNPHIRPPELRGTAMSDQVLMLVLLVSGLTLAAGVTFQLVTGMRMHRPGSQPRRKSHKVIGYCVVALSLLHLPFGILDFVAVFMK